MKHLFYYLVICLALACSSMSFAQENESATGTESEQDQTHQLLKSGKFSQALTQIESSEHSDNAELMYWKGVCLATAERYDEANRILDKVIASWPETRYGKDAIQLRGCLNNRETNATEIVSILKAAFADLRSNLSLIELDMRTLGEDQKHILVGFDFAKNHWQMQAYTDELVFSIASTEEECRWFVPEMKSIYQFSSTFIPWLDVDIEKKEGDQFQYNIRGGLSSEVKSTKAPLKKFLGSKWLSTDDGIYAVFVETELKKGGFPAAIQKDNKTVTCTWLYPNLETAGFYETKYKFVEGRLAETSCPDYQILISYSAKKLDTLKALQWPDVKTRKMTMEPDFVKEFAELLSQFAAPPSPTSMQ